MSGYSTKVGESDSLHKVVFVFVVQVFQSALECLTKDNFDTTLSVL